MYLGCMHACVRVSDGCGWGGETYFLDWRSIILPTGHDVEAGAVGGINYVGVDGQIRLDLGSIGRTHVCDG